MLTNPKVAAAATEYDMMTRRYRAGIVPAEDMHAAYDAMVTAAYEAMNDAYATLMETPKDTGIYGEYAIAQARYKAAVKDAEQVL